MKKKRLPMTPEFDRERETRAWFELVRSDIKADEGKIKIRIRRFGGKSP